MAKIIKTFSVKQAFINLVLFISWREINRDGRVLLET